MASIVADSLIIAWLIDKRDAHKQRGTEMAKETKAEKLMWALQNIEDAIANGRHLIITIETGCEEEPYVDVRVEELDPVITNRDNRETLVEAIALETFEEALLAISEL